MRKFFLAMTVLSLTACVIANVPKVELTASKTFVNPGESVKLAWKTTAGRFPIESAVLLPEPGDVTFEGSRKVTVNETVTILLTSTARAEDGEPWVTRAHVSVETPNSPMRWFRFRHRINNAEFVAATSDVEVLAQIEQQLQLPEAERNMHFNGLITRGKPDIGPWQWHTIPNYWRLAEFSIELCDTNIVDVDTMLHDYVDKAGNICPWGSFVAGEILDTN